MKQMRCVICKRPLLRAAKTVLTKGEPLHFGRQCAIKSGVLVPVPRGPRMAVHEAGEADPRQMTFDMEEPDDEQDRA